MPSAGSHSPARKVRLTRDLFFTAAQEARAARLTREREACAQRQAQEQEAARVAAAKKRGRSRSGQHGSQLCAMC